jgi:hypothetical protein
MRVMRGRSLDRKRRRWRRMISRVMMRRTALNLKRKNRYELSVYYLCSVTVLSLYQQLV